MGIIMDNDLVPDEGILRLHYHIFCNNTRYCQDGLQSLVSRQI